MITIDALIPFNLIVDTDYGLTKLIHEDYNNYDFFYMGLVDADGTDLQYLLQTRTEANPVLNMMVDSENVELGDKLYSQFMEREYDKILQLSCNTALANVSKLLKKNVDQIIKISIMCENQKEIDELKKRKIPCFKSFISKPENINLSDYDALFVKNVTDLDLYKNVESKTIYIPCYEFNVLFLDESPEPIVVPDYMLKYGYINEFNVFTLYTIDPRKMPLP